MKFPWNNMENLLEVKNMGNPYQITWKINKIMKINAKFRLNNMEN